MENYMQKYAIIISELCSKCSLEKKQIQKLMYLLERNGIDLKLNYIIHFYGPYSSLLDYVLHALESQDIITVDTSNSPYTVSSGPVPIEGELMQEEKEILLSVSERFLGKSSIELEAITVLDYVSKNLLPANASDEDIVSKTLEIKGSKFDAMYLLKKIEFIKQITDKKTNHFKED